MIAGMIDRLEAVAEVGRDIFEIAADFEGY
jgi:hypothetical protein